MKTGSPILSYFQAKPLLQSRERRSTHIESSLDLGLTKANIFIEQGGVRFPNGESLSWNSIEKICESKNNCFVIEKGEPHKIIAYSERTDRQYSLMPTNKAPTMLVSGILMHRIKGTDPYRDTLEKVKTVKPILDYVLDTSTGLGYTAIEASKTAKHVITIELDPVVHEIARLNPWSQSLFNNKKITRLIGDCYDVVETFDDNKFLCIIHDPPTFSLAGHLYSGEFYARLYRVLHNGGRMFHYIGNPEGRAGSGITRSVIRRLREAGFSRVIRRPKAFGVVAFKSK